MRKPVFGRKAAAVPAPVPPGLAVVIVPRGAVDSAHRWSLAEALAIFVDHAREDALFATHELVADAVAVAAAYRWSGEIDSRSNGEWLAATSDDEVEAVRYGLRLIGRSDLADHLPADFGPGAAPDVLAFAAEVSDWVRAQPWLLVLGDGDTDRVFKEVMKRLFRANPAFAARAPGHRFTKAQIERRSAPGVAGPTTSLDGLIAEAERVADARR